MLRLNKLLCFITVSFVFLQQIYSFQYGNGNNESSMIFVKVADDVKDVVLGYWESYIIKNDNSLWGTGLEIYKKFGMNGEKIEKKFVKLQEDVSYYDGYYMVKTDGATFSTNKGLNKIEHRIKSASNGIVFIANDDCLYAESENTHGAYGLGKKFVSLNEPTILMPDVINVYSNGYYTQVVNSKHELYITGEHYLPEPYKQSTSFFKVADNVRYSTEGFYITDANELYAFGWCGHGVSGLGKQKNIGIKPTKVMDDVLFVVCNQSVTLIIKTNGDLYGCGGNTPNYAGELGFGNKEPIFIPKLIMKNVEKAALGGCHSAVIKTDGTLWMCGANYFAGGY